MSRTFRQYRDTATRRFLETREEVDAVKFDEDPILLSRSSSNRGKAGIIDGKAVEYWRISDAFIVPGMIISPPEKDAIADVQSQRDAIQSRLNLLDRWLKLAIDAAGEKP
ncbi:MAG TPA: hypothetical protein VMW24_24235 [Sedimentisphaerales bacterium]|nr:hypothetical protein [Sedimentisphaerales bacterium]